MDKDEAKRLAHTAREEFAKHDWGKANWALAQVREWVIAQNPTDWVSQASDGSAIVESTGENLSD
jgi:hypothetical protein